MSISIDKTTICGDGVDLVEECFHMPAGIITGGDDGTAELAEFGMGLKETYDEILSTKSTESNIMRENANINADTAMGSMLKIGSESVKAYADRYMISKRFADLHKQGYIHIHDKDFIFGTTTCCQIDVDALFERGFSTGHGFLRTPNDVQSYTALACIAIQSNQNDQHGGQSIPNFDYAIAKGVAKTFIKEYKLAMMAAVEMRSINPELQDYKEIKAAVENLIGIAEGTTKEQASLTMSPVYKSEEHKGIMALGFDGETATKIQDYSYATAERETDKKTYQAMEALIHNLNTMQCLPGSERIWVKQGEEMRLMSMEEINDTFEPGKYEVLSINSDGCAEWKHITASQRKDNNRRLITLTTRCGQRVRVTDNHTVMTTSPTDNHTIVDVMPEDAEWLLSARAVENVPVRNSICISDEEGNFLDTHVVMSEELAELFGIYTACGSCANDRGGVSFDTYHPNSLSDTYITNLLERALGERLQPDIRSKHEHRIIYKLDEKYCHMFQNVCGAYPTVNRRIPSQILLGTEHVKRAFLRGFYAAGVPSYNKDVQAGLGYLIQSLGELPMRHEYMLPITPTTIDREYDVRITQRAADKLGIQLTNGISQTVETPRHDLTMIWDEVRDKFGREFQNWMISHSITLDELDVLLHDHEMPNIRKYLNFYCSEVSSAAESNSGDEYVYDISVEDNENFMTEDCIFVHNSRAGSQVPFSSINYGTDTTAEGRMVIRNLLEATQAGLGHGETPIFPVQVFKVKDGVNYNPGDPNYDLFKLAMETSAKRLFPNFTFLDAPFNLQYYKPGHPETEVATMGCVDGSETITWRSATNETAQTRSFGETWHLVTKENGIKISGDSLYVEPANMFIYDSSVHDFVRVRKVIKNPNQNNWYRVSFSNGEALTATADHPLPIEGVGRTYVEDIEVGSRIRLSDCTLEETKKHTAGDANIEATVEIIGVEKINHSASSYDVETETDRFDVSGICSHNCRTRVMGNFYDPTREIAYGRGNLSFTSMNLPRLAIEVDGDVDAFFDRLDKLMELTIAQLDERLEWQMRKHVYNFPMLMGQGVWIDSEKLSPSDELGDVLLHGSISVGFIGLAETLRVLTGKHHGESEEAQELGLRIVGHMRSKLDRLAQERRRNYSLLATPAEGLSGRFVNIDRERFGVIEGVTDREYYTNSFHVPVYYECTAYDKICIEAPYHNLCNAGHISYVELDGNPSRNMESYESVIRCMHDAGIGYGSVNFPLDTDPVCGYRGVIKEGNRCPRCGRDEAEPIDKNGTIVGFTRIRRVTGYLSGDYQTRFNDAKQAEVRDRVKHGVITADEQNYGTC